MNNALTINDLHLVADEPRVLDTRIGERLGMAQPLDIRRTIETNRNELEMHGEVFAHSAKTSPKGGRPGTEYWLNEAQTLLLCMFSKTENAALIRKEVIEVYLAYRQGRAPSHETTSQTDATVAIRFSEYSGIMGGLINALEAQRELMEIKTKKPASRYNETVRLLIKETSLNDYEIATRMQPMLGEFMPEWVALHRRRMEEESVRSH